MKILLFNKLNKIRKYYKNNKIIPVHGIFDELHAKNEGNQNIVNSNTISNFAKAILNN